VTDKGKGWAGITIRHPELIANRPGALRKCDPVAAEPFELEVVLAPDGHTVRDRDQPAFFLRGSTWLPLPGVKLWPQTRPFAFRKPAAEPATAATITWARCSSVPRSDQIADVSDLGKDRHERGNGGPGSLGRRRTVNQRGQSNERPVAGAAPESA